MAIDTARKRASAMAAHNRPYMRLVVPTGTLSRPAALGMYAMGAFEPPPNGGVLRATGMRSLSLGLKLGV